MHLAGYTHHRSICFCLLAGNKRRALERQQKIPLQLLTRVIEVSRAFSPCWPQWLFERKALQV